MEKFSINTQKFQLAETASEAATAARGLGELCQHTILVLTRPPPPYNFVPAILTLGQFCPDTKFVILSFSSAVILLLTMLKIIMLCRS